MRYQVPQFIGVEDKIFGPLTLKQFLYVAGGTAIGFILWTFLHSFIAIILIIPISGLFFLLAFYKHNGRPFIYTVEGALKYFLSNRLYIWKKNYRKPKEITKEKEEVKLDLPKLSDSKLKDISWSLDIHENLANVENKDMNFKV